jgi:hypothetical protein
MVTKKIKKYTVNVCRTAYGNHDIVVEAKDEKEAKEKALDEAGNYFYSEHTSEYTVESVSLIRGQE